VKKILITGGAGFFGLNLAKELCKKNKVTILDNFSRGIKDDNFLVLKKIKIYQSSIKI
jgi:nucleoside-diphosphate-sugar epimerase